MLEPSCFAWALRWLPPRAGVAAAGGAAAGGGMAGVAGADGVRGRVGGSGDGNSIGANFPLPHRDYSAKVGRCRLTVLKPVLEAPMFSALDTII